MGGDEFCLLARADDPTLLERAAHALSESGGRFEIRCSYGSVTLTESRKDPVDALRVADQRMYANKRRGRRSSDEAVHQVLLRVAAEHDGELHEHVEDVADLVGAVGRELGLDEAELLEVRRAAALHDIGKVAIPDAILHAPRALTEDEWEYMRQHTIIGERIIRAAPELAGVAEIVRSSHERWDGAGYPDRLTGEEIPLGARIVAVCDTYDAIVTDRAYRKAQSPEAGAGRAAALRGHAVRPEGRRRLRARARARGRSLGLTARELGLSPLRAHNSTLGARPTLAGSPADALANRDFSRALAFADSLLRSGRPGLPSSSSSRTACGNSACCAAGAVASSCAFAAAAEPRPLRDIVRAIIAAAIGVENEVPSQLAQPPKAIVGSDGLIVGPCASLVFSRANVDCRFEPRAVASTHGP